MKSFFVGCFLFLLNIGYCQSKIVGLKISMLNFHKALIDKNIISINQQTDKYLSYGHSNGWVETKTEMINNLETGYMDYISYKEDSLQITINENLAHARFVADINVTMNNKNATYHLKVLEVWVKKGKRWLLFARQAVK